MAQPPDPDGYEKRVAAASTALNSFFDQLVGELDEENGAFPWWSGHSDWKTLALLADFLIQSIQGAEDALLLASLGAQIHRQTLYTDQETLKQAWSTAARAGGSSHDLARAMPRDAAARRRARTITSSAEGCFFHLGQALDRLAAAVIIVGGFQLPEGTDITNIYWSTLEQYAAMLMAGNTKSPILQPQGTSGRAAQEALVVPVQNWKSFGPPDWLPWMKATRNAMTHRAVGMKLNVFTNENKLTRLFYRQPKWSELQSLVFGGKPPAKPFFGSFMMKPAEDVLDGLCDSTTQLIAAVVQAMMTCWTDRQTVPSMIVQHGGQWSKIEPQSAWSFDGYGNTVEKLQGELMMNPSDAKRWRAARIEDSRRAEWY